MRHISRDASLVTSSPLYVAENVISLFSSITTSVSDGINTSPSVFESASGLSASVQLTVQIAKVNISAIIDKILFNFIIVFYCIISDKDTFFFA